MTHEELLYEALKRPLGVVVKADVSALRKAKAKLAKSDAAILELAILGPDRAGQIFIIRSLEARRALGEHRLRGSQPRG